MAVTWSLTQLNTHAVKLSVRAAVSEDLTKAGEPISRLVRMASMSC